MKKIERSSKLFKILSIVGNVLLYTIFILSFCLLIFTIGAKKSGKDGINVFGHSVYTVLTPSMEQCDKTDVSNFEIKSLPVDTLISVDRVPENKEEAQKFYADIKVGDVLTFKYYYSEQTTITHRVIKIEQIEGGYIFTMAGDNKADNQGVLEQVVNTTEESSFNYIVGKVVWANYTIGAIITFLKNPISMVFIIIVPCALVIIYEIFKIIMYFANKKKEENLQEIDDKNKEIEELKKKLQEAESKDSKE